MKKVILLAMFMPFMAYGQIVEDFESGNLNSWITDNTGRWQADMISPLSGSFSLHHVFDNPEAGTDRIALPTGDLQPSRGSAKWSFMIRHGYDPSSSNNWAVFLMSDAAPSMSFTGGTSGFAIGVNITGSDDTLRLVKVTDGIIQTVVRCRINWQVDIGIASPVKIEVERSAAGSWIVTVFKSTGETIGSYSGSDPELFRPAWFGIIYRYTATKDRLLWLDDINISGIFISDKEPPVPEKLSWKGGNVLELVLNEQPDDDFITRTNFSLNNNSLIPSEVKQLSQNCFLLFFTEQLKNKTINELTIFKACDLYGNCAENIQLEVTPVWAEPGDVVISEIMADPQPEAGLPGVEYLELTNTSQYQFDLKGWKLFAGTQSYLFPDKMLRAGEILALCSISDTSELSEYGEVAGFKQFAVLTDEGKLIYITDSTSALIHGVEYSDSWYRNSLKSEGGWSLEMIDTGSPFTGEENWTASVSSIGGTPGTINSVKSIKPDSYFKGPENVFPYDSLDIKIMFSEPVIDLPVTGLRIGDLHVIDIEPGDPLRRIYSVKLSSPLLRNVRYILELSSDVKDFRGNQAEINQFAFGLPERPGMGDIKFNELLFDPMPGGKDFIELYNCSGKIVDASRLMIVTVNDEIADTSSARVLSSENRCIMPGAFYTVTAISEPDYDSSDLSCIFEIQDMPSLPVDEGHLVLYNRQLMKIDEAFYTEEMHYPLLSSTKGVSLEKTNPCLASEIKGNWHSASENSGWSTPCSPNSVFSELPVTSDELTLSSTRITPDNNGFEDFLTLGFRLEGTGNVLSVTIFDESGNKIRELADNVLAAPEDTFIWDGTAGDGSQVRTGIYIILVRLYDEKGKSRIWKKVCTVIR